MAKKQPKKQQPKKQPIKSLYMMTLGCPKNRVDSEVMLGTLQHRGYHLVQEPEDADVIVVNTCAFLKAAEQESVDNILELAEHKKTGRCKTLVVTGCLVQRHGDARQGAARGRPLPRHRAPTCRWAICLAAEASPRQLIADPEYIHDATVPRVNSMPGYTAYLKISEGCDNRCAFCIIPKLRGASAAGPSPTSSPRPSTSPTRACVELNLVAQDLTAYGHDLPGKPEAARAARASWSRSTCTGFACTTPTRASSPTSSSR